MTGNCFQCQYFFVTWDPKSPRGCKAYGFKTRELPSAVVKRSSGMECLKYEQKKGAAKQ
ncbi:uracil-DNA glycosylase [Sporosarcina highlanderae]|uniref:Uracil-DNA glycosylase n=1 Tax=Sporosarcina highlanderae TaxID=3035916 RepID=A0ABT8JLW2_9BACL|nr:uracil-DNA glycosylase [Sporosarcina highlanderae]MDN4606060.1 uracil-DNA glycosylase [Sporosarcina highlanderae]